MRVIRVAVMLALVMALCLAASAGVFVGATVGSYSDLPDGYPYSGAIGLLSELNIMEGTGGGLFAPTQAVTREQLAKILFVLVTATDNGQMFGGASPFDDVAAERWSAGFVAWAKETRAVQGRGDNKFSPEDPVTAQEAAKMFIGVLGYDTQAYTFPHGCVDKAKTIGLFDGIEGLGDGVGAMQRGQIAQMAANALFVDAPRFDSYVAAIGSTGVSSTGVTTLAARVHGLFKCSGLILEGISSYALDATFTEPGKMCLSGEFYSFKGAGEGQDYTYPEAVRSMVGDLVNVWYQSDRETGGTPTGDDSILTLERNSSCRSYEFSVADVEPSGTTDSIVEFSHGDGTKLLSYSAAEVMDSAGQSAELGENVFEGSSPSYGSCARFKLVDRDNDGKAELAIVTRAITAKVASVNQSRLSLSDYCPAGGIKPPALRRSDDFERIVLGSGVAEGVYVEGFSYTAFAGDEMRTMWTFDKAETLSQAKLTRASGKELYFGDRELRVDPSFTGLSFSTNNVGNRYKLVLNKNGYIVFAERASDTLPRTNWILVIGGDMQHTTSGDRLTSLTYYNYSAAKKTLGLDPDSFEFNGEEYMPLASELIGGLFQYTLGSSGKIDSLRSVEYLVDQIHEFEEAQPDSSSVSYNSVTTLLDMGGGKSGYVTSSTLIFCKTTAGRYRMISPTAMRSFAAGSYKASDAIVDVDGNYVLLYLHEGDYVPVRTADRIALITGVAKNEADESDRFIYEFTAAVDGETTILKTDAIRSDDQFDDLFELTDDGFAGFKLIEFDDAGLVEQIGEPVSDQLVLRHIRVDRQPKALSIVGKLVTAEDIAENPDGDGYVLESVGGECPYNEVSEDCSFMLVLSAPVDADIGGGIGRLDSEVEIVAAAAGSVTPSGDGTAYIASILYDTEEEEIISIYLYEESLLDLSAAE